MSSIFEKQSIWRSERSFKIYFLGMRNSYLKLWSFERIKRKKRIHNQLNNDPLVNAVEIILIYIILASG